MKKRQLVKKLKQSLEVSPIVYLNGMRQSGKSTLVLSLIESGQIDAEYITFDNPTQMYAAASAPDAFLRAMKKSVVIDEVQLVPEIFRVLKTLVDDMRFENKGKVSGKYLLTGSANIMGLPKMSDPLVGRMVPITLYPFSGSEIIGSEGKFIDNLFEKKFQKNREMDIDILDVMRKATFPEISGQHYDTREIWFNGYLTTLLQRDVRALAQLEKIAIIPQLFKVLASRVGNLINESEIGRELQLNSVTTKTYRNILKLMFLVFDIEPWSRNLGKRLVKSPKGYIGDTLLMCHLLGIHLETLPVVDSKLFGHVLENFVATELKKLLSFSDKRLDLYHFRTQDGKEVDFVIEKPSGEVAGIEVKASESLKTDDFKGLRILKAEVGKKFCAGVILYRGKDVVAFEEDLYAVPLSALWS